MSFGTNSPFGLKPVQLMGQVWNNQVTTYYIPTAGAVFNPGTGAVSVFTNDPLIQTNTGGVNLAPTASGPILGTFQGCSYLDPLSKLPVFRPYLASGQTTAGGPIEIYVTTNTDILYEIQIANAASGSAGPNLTTTNVNNNARFDVVAATYNDGSAPNPGIGNVNTGISGYYLSASTITAAQQTYPLTIVQLTPSIFNNIYANVQGSDVNGPVKFNTALVRLNTSYFTSIDGSSAGI